VALLETYVKGEIPSLDKSQVNALRTLLQKYEDTDEELHTELYAILTQPKKRETPPNPGMLKWCADLRIRLSVGAVM
jgi:hypothetical protein